MTVVIDANLIAALVLSLPYSELASQKIVAWKKSGREIVAPFLMEYELASVFRKAIHLKTCSPAEVPIAFQKIDELNIHLVPPTVHLHQKALEWAEKIGQVVAYDAHYLAVSEDFSADFWTADERLAKAAQACGAGWVYWLNSENSIQND